MQDAAKSVRIGARLTPRQRQTLEALAAAKRVTLSNALGALLDDVAQKPVMLIRGNSEASGHVLADSTGFAR